MSSGEFRQIKIHNIRFGRATNSSSSHSIVIIPRPTSASEQIDPYGGYGRNMFQLVTKESKRNYIAAQIFTAMGKLLPADMAWIAATRWAGASGVIADPSAELNEETLEEIREKWDAADGVDHQSVMDLPMEWPSQWGSVQKHAVDRDFLADFLAFIDRDDVVICGGSDESDAEDSPLKGTGRDFGALFSGYSSAKMLARKDGSYWTMINTDSGNKIRFSFADEPAPFAASAPELVDLSITDYCNEGCGFCYRGSTTRGAHAKREDLHEILRALAEEKVFEVAIGGGEPTLHPLFFSEILGSIRRRGMIPNFTTRKLDWLSDVINVKRVLDAGAAFAFSVHNAEDVARLSRAIASTGAETDLKVYMQHALGSLVDEEQFAELIRAAESTRFSLTLLGYKQTGRGKAFGEKPSSRWMDILESSAAARDRYGRWIGIDTVIAKKYEHELAQRGVPAMLITPSEGTFSCFINAVTGRLHSSSYDDTEGVQIMEMNRRSYEYPCIKSGVIREAFVEARAQSARNAL